MGTFLRPGTVFILVLALLVGLGVYNWSEDLFPQPEKTASFECSRIEVSFVERQSNGTHTSVFLQVNTGRSYAITFHGGGENFTRIVEEPGREAIREIQAPVSPVSSMEVKVNGCSRVFRP
ncbi:MAG: hypothetical protein ABEJ91_03525 [Candidatus Nanohaloarchaea archaeon]